MSAGKPKVFARRVRESLSKTEFYENLGALEVTRVTEYERGKIKGFRATRTREFEPTDSRRIGM